MGRLLIKKGKAIRLGDKEIEYNPNFRLFLHTKMANPHYKPELQAQTTLINFTVTRQGLEDQLLAEVVKADRPDLEEQKAELTRQQNEYKILLKGTVLPKEIIFSYFEITCNYVQSEKFGTCYIFVLKVWRMISCCVYLMPAMTF